MLFGGILCRYVTSGWVYIFLLTSLFGFIWLPLWLLLVTDSPYSHPRISEKEKNYITKELNLNIDNKKKHIPLADLPWKNFLRSKPIIGLFITECCNLFGLFFFYTNVGKILTEIHHVPTQHAGYILAGGFILMPISCVGSGMRIKLDNFFYLKFRFLFHIKRCHC
jgi:ACS family sodium-dependent inorganic phosphate cotransporter